MNNNFRKLFSLSSIYALGSLMERALAFVFIPIYTTFLSTKDYGIVALMSITIAFVSRFISSPIDNAFIRHYYSPEYKDKKGELVFNLFLFMLIQSILLSCLYWIVSGHIANVILDNKDLVYIVRIYAFILFFHPFSSFFQNLLQMLEKAKYFVCVILSKLILSACLILYLLIVLKKGVLALILGELFGSIFIFIVVFPFFAKISKFKLSPSLLKEPFKYAYPLIFSAYSNFLIQSGDRYVLRVFNPLSTVGLYSFGYAFAGLINIILVIPLKNALNPIIYSQEENPDQLRLFLRNYSTYFYLIGIFLFLAISLFSKEMITLIARKREFWDSWIIVPIIAFSYVQHGLGNFLGKGIIMMKKTWHASIVVIITAIVNLGLNFLFIPMWGILGAAFATLISYIVWNGLKMYFSAKFYNLHFELGRLGYITFIGIGLYALPSLILRGGNIWSNIGFKMLFLISYPFIFYLTGFFADREKKFIKEFIDSIKANGIMAALKELKSKSNSGEIVENADSKNM